MYVCLIQQTNSRLLPPIQHWKKIKQGAVSCGCLGGLNTLQPWSFFECRDDDRPTLGFLWLDWPTVIGRPSWTWRLSEEHRTVTVSRLMFFSRLFFHEILCLQLIRHIREAAIYVCILGKIIQDWYICFGSGSDHLKSTKNSFLEASNKRCKLNMIIFPNSSIWSIFSNRFLFGYSVFFPWLGTKIHPNPSNVWRQPPAHP